MFEVWNKPRMQLTAFDEMIIAVQMMAVILFLWLIFTGWLKFMEWKNRR